MSFEVELRPASTATAPAAPAAPSREISITPPLPVVEVEFDEVLGLKDLRLPLDRRIWKRVRLVAVI